MKKINNLHCGACMENFDNMDLLNKHLDNCPAAKVLLPTIYKIYFGKDKTGHPLFHFIQNLHKNAHLIKRYAYSIADEMDSLHRSKIHVELCKNLGLDYNLFQPFESSEIRQMPSRKVAEEILWEALYHHIEAVQIEEKR